MMKHTHTVSHSLFDKLVLELPNSAANASTRLWTESFKHWCIFAGACICLHLYMLLHLTRAHVWSHCFYLQRGPWLCVYTATLLYRCALRQAAKHTQEVNRTSRIYISMFPLSVIWFKQGHSVSCIPQALFPSNSLDVVLSLGLGGGVKGIIYCLFSKANVQAWHISFAIVIKICF